MTSHFTQLLSAMLIALLGAMPAGAATTPKARLVVFSDCHTLAPGLMAQGSKSLATAAEGDSRLTAQSPELLQSMVSRALELKPQAVLVTGDLTSNGEMLSHRYVASQLGRLQDAGIKVLVVPGNHDISNPYAVSYGKSGTEATATITRSDWRKIYRGMGYDPATSQLDTASLSYCAEPVPGLVVLGIDTNRDEENQLKSRGDTANTYHTAGRIRPTTLHWLADRAREARAAGKEVVAMCHHHVADHFDGEHSLLKNYVIARSQAAIDTLTAAGVHLLLTGHLHVTDAARAWNSAGTDSITELATGSLITYPLNYRVIDVAGSKATYITGTIATEVVTAQARTQIERTAPAMIKGKVGALYNKMQGKMQQLTSMLSFGSDEEGDLGMPSREDLDAAIDGELAPMIAQGMLLVLGGNEGQNGGTEAMQNLSGMFDKAMDLMMPAMMGGMGKMITGSIYPMLEGVATSLLEDRNCVDTEHDTVVDDHEGAVAL